MEKRADIFISGKKAKRRKQQPKGKKPIRQLDFTYGKKKNFDTIKKPQ
jgi:hypothetical protein